MPGIPRSQRCQGCMRRKIRCDLNWPVCSPCKRSGTPCSGPPTGAKFIHNGCHRTKSAAAHASTSGEQQALVSDAWPQRPAPQAVARPPPPHTIVDVSSRAVQGGASYACFRLSAGPRANPTTLADRLAAHLSRLLNKDPHGGALLGMSYVVHLPQRMAHSPALRDCVALFCSGWSSYLRGADPDDLVDHRAYGKALRSLQRALDSRQDQLRCETLAAISILERFDVLFDRNRGYNRTMHGRGIHSLMLKRGPPDPNDELDRRLAVENRSVLLSLWVVEDGDNFFLTPEWKAALEPPPVHSGSPGENTVRTHSFIGYLGIWPKVVREMRRLQGGEMPLDEVLVNAARLQKQIQELLGEIEADGVPLLEEARKSNLFSVVADPDPPIGEKYEFTQYGAAEMVITYYAVKSLVHNIMWLLQKLQGLPDDAVYAEYLDDCYNCWMAMPYLRSMGSLASMQNSTPFLLSYEAAGPEVKKHILDWIIEQDQHKKRFPDDREQVERIVLNVGRGMVGRVTFDTSPPPSAPSSPP